MVETLKIGGARAVTDFEVNGEAGTEREAIREELLKESYGVPSYVEGERKASEMGDSTGLLILQKGSR